MGCGPEHSEAALWTYYQEGSLPELLFILCLGIQSLSGFRAHTHNGSQQSSLHHWLSMLWPSPCCPFSLPTLTSLPAPPLEGKWDSVVEMWVWFPINSHPISIPQCKIASLRGLGCLQQHYSHQPRIGHYPNAHQQGVVELITVYPANEILDSNENKQSTTTCNNLDESCESKEHIEYASTWDCSKTVGCWQSIGFNLI